MDLNEDIHKENELTISNIDARFGKMGLTEEHERENWTASSALLSNDGNISETIIPIPSFDKFVYYISQMDTGVIFKKGRTSNEGHPVDKSETENLVTYESIGGFSAQMEIIRETIELPLKHPNLFRECGWYFDI